MCSGKDRRYKCGEEVDQPEFCSNQQALEKPCNNSMNMSSDCLEPEHIVS